jgi:peptidoglycan/LPS O-acetylase OafA/YrhL
VNRNQNPNQGYIPTLDGWRALSVITVVLYHGRDIFFCDYPQVRQLLSHCDLGVDVFFAISGFLICGQLVREQGRDGNISLRRFYARRCLRILPASYTYLAVICILSALVIIPVNYSEFPSCLLFYRNFMPLGGDVQGGVYTAHFWSLAVEEQFYLLWPMLLILLKSRRAARVAFLLAATAYVWKVAAHSQWIASLLPPAASLLSRADTILWGCIAAIYFPLIRRWVIRVRFTQLWLPVAAILPVAFLTHIPELVSLSSIMLTALVLSTVLQPGSLLARFLEWQPLRWIGTLSYSIYVWQELFLSRPVPTPAKGALHYLQQPGWSLLAILVCACASRYLIEIPVSRFRHGPSISPLRFLSSIPPAGGAPLRPYQQMFSIPVSRKAPVDEREHAGKLAS